ncbi:hypothetical protein [Klebsiella quasipneumoniae]|uniref:hypothetical protein n=1 Tax=Klebsiella quasipneumoniae TaxID=1463165 RepID=UPI00220D3BC6|nr:hypothetical protein [Klebsiella quasipneumoniae]BDO05838.1 hypothetical protein KAM622c_54250 [Klebsiella quasipneumoniae subsp. quasipneumoniae]
MKTFSKLAFNLAFTLLTVADGRIGLITFTDKNGTKQVEQVYSCTSLAANTFGKRFTTWLEEIFQKHNEEKVADSGFEAGTGIN